MKAKVPDQELFTFLPFPMNDPSQYLQQKTQQIKWQRLFMITIIIYYSFLKKLYNNNFFTLQTI
jgi:hypothetical protein